MAADIRTTKVLCHADGALFCNYRRDAKDKGYVHVIYLTDEAVAPDPTTRDIEPGGITNVEDLVWFEFEAFVRPIADRTAVLGTFNYDEAEFIAW